MSNVLQSLSIELAQATESAGESIVRIEGRRRAPASGIIWSEDGVVITAHHVVEQDEAKIGLPDGEVANTKLIGRDPTTDLAVLKVEAKSLNAAKWAEPDSLKVGHLVLALGRPGRTIQATLGVVSAVGGTWRTPAGGEIDRYLQTDVVMYPGFSGGPLIGAGGEFLGLNSSWLMRGVSVAVPITTLKHVSEQLLAHGKVRRGFLGIGAQPVRLPDSLASELHQETGLLLASVENGSPAEKSGLVLGDTIVSLAGEPVRHLDDLLSLLSGDRVGKTVTAQIVRGGKLTELSVTIGERE